MITKVFSAIPFGFDGKIIEVEGDMNRGLPSFNIVGMANKTVNEARERVRSAICNSDFIFPSHKVTINLAPADLAKDGAYLDLPIALSVLALSRQLLQSNLHSRLFVGELSLTGELKPVRGILHIIEAAKQAQIREVFIPRANYAQACLIRGITIFPVDNLKQLFLHLKGLQAIKISPDLSISIPEPPMTQNGPFLDEIHGQNLAKRALEIAIAGHHNLLLSGPPGAGKTLLAKTARNLLPELSEAEQIELTKIYSLSEGMPDQIVTTRPFRNPHHTASLTSLIGGGAKARPGEISLAHRGILFLDEIPDSPARISKRYVNHSRIVRFHSHALISKSLIQPILC